MKKISLAILLFVMAVSCARAEEKIFVEYPTLGECTADSVRIRRKPDTDTEIIGRLTEFDKL